MRSQWNQSLLDSDSPEIGRDLSSEDEGQDEDISTGSIEPAEDLENAECVHFESDSPPPGAAALFTFENHTQPIYSVAFHPTNPSVVISGSGDHCVYVWTNEEAKLLEPQFSDSVVDVGFTSDGSKAVAAALDGLIRIWDAHHYSLRHEVDIGQDLTWMRLHPTGSVVLAGTASGLVWLIDVNNAKVLSVFSGGHSGSCTAGAFSRSILTASSDGSVVSWDARSSSVSWKIQKNREVTTLALEQDMEMAFAGDIVGNVFLIHLGKGEVKAALTGHTGSVEAVGVNRHFGWCASGSLDKTARVWDIPTNSLRHCFRPESEVVQLRWHPTIPHLFIAGCEDGTVVTWDARTSGEPVHEYYGHVDTILALDVQSSGELMVTGSDDATCRLWAV